MPDVKTDNEGSFRRPLLWAAVGSSVLAVPGGIGLATLVTLFGVPTDSEAIGFYSVAFVAAFIGFALLAGYWSAWRAGVASARGPAFWWTSAAFNAIVTLAIGATAIATVANSVGDSAIMAMALVPATWTGWMTWLGVTNALAANVEGGERTPEGPTDLPLIAAILGNLWLVGQSLFSVVSLFLTLGAGVLWDRSMTIWIVSNVIGLAFLVGYVWDWRRGLPPSEAALFWWASAGFHAIALGMWVWNLTSSFQSLLEYGDPLYWLTSVAWMSFGAWMVWFSLTRVQRANVGSHSV